MLDAGVEVGVGQEPARSMGEAQANQGRSPKAVAATPAFGVRHAIPAHHCVPAS
jgi:hypothetical protein